MELDTRCLRFHSLSTRIFWPRTYKLDKVFNVIQLSFSLVKRINTKSYEDIFAKIRYAHKNVYNFNLWEEILRLFQLRSVILIAHILDFCALPIYTYEMKNTKGINLAVTIFVIIAEWNQNYSTYVVSFQIMSLALKKFEVYVYIYI